MYSNSPPYNCIVLLGPTAVGKTALGVRMAKTFGYEIISADSRQVYKGLDIGSGKDLTEYGIGKDAVPYHLIDCTTLNEEYNVFSFQTDFYKVFSMLRKEKKIPLVVGGTGLYLDSFLKGYTFVPVGENQPLREELSQKSTEELSTLLLALKPNLHNKSDLVLRERMIRAIEIETFMQSPAGIEAKKALSLRPTVKALVLGTTVPRSDLHNLIKNRLDARLLTGLIEEVEALHTQSGYSWERLKKLGLEYRFVSEYLLGERGKEEMQDALFHAICQFAKRQETWFRGMEKKGLCIHWLPKVLDLNARYTSACDILSDAEFMR